MKISCKHKGEYCTVSEKIHSNSDLVHSLRPLSLSFVFLRESASECFPIFRYLLPYSTSPQGPPPPTWLLLSSSLDLNMCLPDSPSPTMYQDGPLPESASFFQG